MRWWYARQGLDPATPINGVPAMSQNARAFPCTRVRATNLLTISESSAQGGNISTGPVHRSTVLLALVSHVTTQPRRNASVRSHAQHRAARTCASRAPQSATSPYPESHAGRTPVCSLQQLPAGPAGRARPAEPRQLRLRCCHDAVKREHVGTQGWSRVGCTGFRKRWLTCRRHPPTQGAPSPALAGKWSSGRRPCQHPAHVGTPSTLPWTDVDSQNNRVQGENNENQRVMASPLALGHG